MPLPGPEPGLVIRYSYLWHDEARQGREEGVKDRPCAMVLATQRDDDEITVIVAPITHTDPASDTIGLPLPIGVKRRLGLDSEPSWIVTNDVNVFTWPGPDIRPIGDEMPAGYAYGHLPQKLTDRMLDMIRSHAKNRSLSQVPRD